MGLHIEDLRFDVWVFASPARQNGWQDTRKSVKKDVFDKYLSEINAAYLRGDATEHTHRPVLKGLIEVLGDKVTATNEPRQIGVGYERRIHAGISWERRQRLEKELPEVWQSGIETV